MNDGAAVELKDRKVGLIIYGAIQIVFGLSCLGFTPLLLLATAVSAAAPDQSQAMPVSIMLPGLFFYAMLGAWGITMGVGSIMARRWARALVLVGSWMWLIGGVFGMLFMLIFMGGMYEKMGESGQIPKAAVATMKIVMYVFSFIFYVAVPAAFVIFYRSRHVKATCEARNPEECWTDRCPLPVLAVSLSAAVTAPGMLSLGCYGWMFPFFGTLLMGPAGAVMILVVIALLCYIALGMYRLDIRAWWCSLVVVTVWSISTVVTFTRVDLVEMYEKMNFPEAQIELMKQSGTMLSAWALTLPTALWSLILIGCLIYVKKYFVASGADSQ